jgi:hypothetical protein
MLKATRTITLLFGLVALISCSRNSTPEISSTGNASEILVVATEHLWQSAAGDSLKAVLSAHAAELLLPEPEFNLVFVPENKFDKTLQLHHNIIMLQSDISIEKNKVETLRDVWSKPQRVIKIKAGSDTAICNLIGKHGKPICELFRQNERALLRAKYAGKPASDIEKTIEQQTAVKLKVPDGFKIDKQSKGMVSLIAEENGLLMGLLIYTAPYRDTMQMNPAGIMLKRDSLIHTSFLSAEKISTVVNPKHLQPISQQIFFKELLSIETRGIWKLQSDSTRQGPFINYTIADAPGRRIVTFDGFVSNQGKPSINYIRKLEWMIWEAEFSDK